MEESTLGYKSNKAGRTILLLLLLIIIIIITITKATRYKTAASTRIIITKKMTNQE